MGHTVRRVRVRKARTSSRVACGSWVSVGARIASCDGRPWTCLRHALAAASLTAARWPLFRHRSPGTRAETAPGPALRGLVPPAASRHGRIGPATPTTFVWLDAPATRVSLHVQAAARSCRWAHLRAWQSERV